jgi:hypothetical protein
VLARLTNELEFVAKSTRLLGVLEGNHERRIDDG